MKSERIRLGEIKLAGITARTTNQAEMNPETAKIAATLAKYFEGKIYEKVSNRLKPGTTYCVYTNYETDKNGPYTYFVGEEVNSFDNLAPILETLTIPKQNYTKFNVGPGSRPAVCINAWQNIWSMSTEDLGGKRRYIADFEIYDERALDPENTSLDIYIGLKDA